MERETVDLCGIWRFQPDPSGEGEAGAYFAGEYDDRPWREARLPAVFEDCAPGLESYEGAGWFRRRVSLPAGWGGKRVELRFLGANYHTKVWVNGEEAGQNEDGFLPFFFPVQDLIRPGKENLIAVRVDNRRRQGELPGMQYGWRTYGGILREVELEASDSLAIDRVAVTAQPESGGRGELEVGVGVRNGRSGVERARVAVQVLDGEENLVGTFSCSEEEITPGGGYAFSWASACEGVRPWSPGDPALYRARVELICGEQVVDVQEVRFGFRRIEARDGKLLLNGEPIYLTGFNRHEDSAPRGAASDLETAERDLRMMKEAGANFVRLCHYPHHPGELDLCDEIGLMAMDEIPLYWWNGLEEGEEKCAAKLEGGKRQLRTMIGRDVNHPSVIFWSVSNETVEQREEVVAGNAELVRLARELDGSRPAVHVSCHWQEEPHFEEDDVVCVNGYPALDRRGFRGEREYDFGEGTACWREQLERLHARYPGKPILVTEFGYASLSGVRDNGHGEEAQAEAIAAEFLGMDAAYVCGATIWCWADHAWPPNYFSYCHHLAISPYGVVTRDRRGLQAYGRVRQLFREKQGIADPPPVSRGPDEEDSPAGDNIHMIRPHLREIPQVAFPEGYGIRPLRIDEGALWLDIEQDAEEYLAMPYGTFEREFGGDPQAVQWRSFIATDEKGSGVGTISAWYYTYRGEDYGLIHWVAVRRAHQGKGLGKAMVSFALGKLAQWHDKALLGTQTKRIPAIKLYLDFGFAPDLEEEGGGERWRKVAGKLRHPALEGLSL